ncbi:MAG TPA: GFA family protein [Steroidobacteraceae bacterium]|nr:GFA family protein [Steroidobacteraceae bacterium]
MKKTYQGSCHCGAVRFEAGIDLAAGTVKCNCSICRKGRNWLAAVAPADFRLLSGEADLGEYQFGSRSIHHRFCKRCGLRPFSHKADKSFYAVNLACLDNAEPDELIAAPVAFVDGLHDDFRKPPQETRHL